MFLGLFARAAVWLGVALLTVAGISSAQAQSTAEPSHIDERFRPKPAQPTLGPPIEIPSTPRSVAPAGSEGIQFTLTSVSFDGNTTLPAGKLQAIVAPYIGHAITLAQAYEIADRVTAAYRDAGYILTRAVVPPQHVSSGHLTLRIVEGYIDRVQIQGNAGGATSYLEAYGQRIAAQRPLTAAVLERELLLANDITGLNVRSVLTPSASSVGGADLTLVVDRKPVNGYAAVDNRGSKYLGPYEIMGGVFFNDVFNTAGRLGLNAVVTPDSGPDLAYGAVSYDQPIGTNGLRLFSSLSYTRTRPGAILRTLDTKGSALNGDLSLSYPIIRSRDLNLMTSVGFAYHDVRSSNFAVSPLFSDHIRALNANIFLNALDDWGGFSTLSVSVTQGLEIFGATRSGSPDKSRVGASGSYTRANFEATHDQPLFDPISLFLSASGQTSFGKPLLASEQYALGGTNYDRAFDPSEVTGDSAIAGRAELRWDLIDRLSFLSGIQLYGFYEGGEVWQAEALPGTLDHETLYSTGAGLRFAIADRVNADVEWAKPLHRDVAANGNRDSRFFFTVSTNF